MVNVQLDEVSTATQSELFNKSSSFKISVN